jgi:ferritin
MIPELVTNALHQQINAELKAWYDYLGMSSWCSSQQLAGCAQWLRAQAQEEYTHAMKLYDFVIDRNLPLHLHPVSEPKEEFKSIVEVFEAALRQEEENTSRIDALFELAQQQKSFAALVELQWFVTEQVEEEKTARRNLAHVRMVADDPAAILDFDSKLGERQPVIDTQVEG